MDNLAKLRQTWEAVAPSDYEAHMARIGQAEANARHVAAWLRSHPEAKRIVFAGAGTGQMFDFLGGHEFQQRNITFTDINQSFLDTLQQRLKASPAFDWTVVPDDLLSSNLGSGFDAAVLVLVLEHVDWPKALATIPQWGCQHVLIVIQENPAQIATAVSPGAPLGPTMQPFLDSTRPHLIPLPDLRSVMQQQGYGLQRIQTTFVLDKKMMHACSFHLGQAALTQHSYRPELSTYFESLNIEWLEKHFVVEDLDRAYFAAPYEKIIAKRGQIFFAELAGDYIGTASLIPVNEKQAELGKLAVTASAQGKGIGKHLLDWVIAYARETHFEEVILYSDSKLDKALRLYERHGFEHRPFQSQGYLRGDIAMALKL